MVTLVRCCTNALSAAYQRSVALGMYITTRDIAGGTFMTCKDCGQAISMNKICEKPIQAATDSLRHMATHNASGALVGGGCLTPTLKAVRAF
jgi:hypothetical protein